MPVLLLGLRWWTGLAGRETEILDGFIRVFLLSRLAGLRERVSYGRISSIDYMLNVLRNQGSLSLEGISVRYQRSFPHGGGPDPMMSRMGLARSPLPAPDAEPTDLTDHTRAVAARSLGRSHSTARQATYQVNAGNNPKATSAMASVDPNELLTEKSLALSLAPPRAPPIDTPHRSLLTGLDPHHSLQRTAALADDEDVYHQTHSYYTDHTLRQRLSTLLPHIHLSLPRRLSHPHLPAGPELGDRMTRALGSTLSLERQNALRDGGGFRRIVDTLITLSVPGMAIGNPKVAQKFMDLTNNNMTTLRYGRHPMQKIDLLLPSSTGRPLGGLLFFVHGGAWGSGLPWMYRLVAAPFLEDLNMAVAIVGYRTFPDADVPGQVQDLERAADLLYRERRDLFDASQSRNPNERYA